MRRKVDVHDTDERPQLLRANCSRRYGYNTIYHNHTEVLRSHVPTQISTGSRPAPILSPTFSNATPILLIISHSVRSSGSRSLYPSRTIGGRSGGLNWSREESVRTSDGKDAVLYVTSAMTMTSNPPSTARISLGSAFESQSSARGCGRKGGLNSPSLAKTLCVIRGRAESVSEWSVYVNRQRLLIIYRGLWRICIHLRVWSWPIVEHQTSGTQCLFRHL